jgi:hypothetical protein
MWEREEGIHSLKDVADRLSLVQSRLKRWSLDKFEAMNKELNLLRDKLEEVSRQSQDNSQVQNTENNKLNG